MSKFVIGDLAKLVNMTPQRLLERLKEAGISAHSTSDTLSDQEIQKFQAHLQVHQGDPATEANKTKITLHKGKSTLQKRKTTNVLKQGKKSISIEFRKKRQRTPPPEETTPAETHTPTQEIQHESAVAATEQPTLIADETKSADLTKELTPTEPAAPQKEQKKKKDSSQPAPKKKDSRTRRHERSWEHEELSTSDRKPSARRKKKRTTTQQSAGNTTIQHEFEKPQKPVAREVWVPASMTVAELAQKMSLKASEIIKTMMQMGIQATTNQSIDQDTAILIVEEMGHLAHPLELDPIEAQLSYEEPPVDAKPVPRAPVVTVMGHVDHGKTSLLDMIRSAHVAGGEAGGITQQVGAYHVTTQKGMITFLDTPGHEAFTAMRARGAQCTDIVVLVVAADDSVMPQTIEAIQHAKAAEVPIIVAINKMDKPEADPERVQNELSQHGITPEAWGGETIVQPISAKTGKGIDALLDSIILQSELLELKAISSGAAQGIVIESRIDKGHGPVSTVLVTQGTLHKGDILLAGCEYGRIRKMLADNGQPCQEAGPSIPVELFGLSGTPDAGDKAVVVKDEKKARDLSKFRQRHYRTLRFTQQQTTHLESIFEGMATGKTQEDAPKALTVVLRADTQGSLEAIMEALHKLSSDEVKINIVANAVGGITISDANLALASHAIIIGFNVRADLATRAFIAKENIDLHYYSVIYDLINEVKQALSGLLSPEIREKILGLATVREVFRSSKLGAIAGCMVLEGQVKRNCPIRVLRNQVVIYEGKLESLRRFKEDVETVRLGMECGIGVKNYNDIKVSDQIECYEQFTVERTL